MLKCLVVGCLMDENIRGQLRLAFLTASACVLPLPQQLGPIARKFMYYSLCVDDV